MLKFHACLEKQLFNSTVRHVQTSSQTLESPQSAVVLIVNATYLDNLFPPVQQVMLIDFSAQYAHLSVLLMGVLWCYPLQP